MNPKPGQFFASRSNTFIGTSIQNVAKIREKRINHYKNCDIFWNHIGIFIEIDGALCIGEALTKGFVIHPWKGSEYETRKTEYIICELYNDFTPDELIDFTKIVRGFEGIKYDFEGIADSFAFALTGVWKGKKNEEAREKMFCSEAFVTAVNDVHPNTFPYPWCWSPQMVIESKNIKIFKNQPYYEKH